MARPLMPKATAVWLVDKTTLSFDQIADFCGMHVLEVQAIADGEVAAHIMGLDPVAGGQLTMEEIKRCEADSKTPLKMVEREMVASTTKKKAKYTPLSKRIDRPNAIAWLIEKHPELSDKEIAKLIKTTKNAIDAIRNKTYKGYEDLNPQSPVLLGLCSEHDLNKAIAMAVKVIPVK